MDTETQDAPTGLDIAAAAEQIGSDLFPDQAASLEKGTDDAPADAPPPAEAAAPSAPTVRAVPKSWSKDYHDHWGKIDPAAQEYIEKRETDFLNGLEQYKTDAQWAKSIRESLNPYRQTLQNLKVDEAQAIKSLFNADHLLRTSPNEQRLQYFMQLAQNYGVDLKGLMPKTDAQAPPANPELEAIKQQVSQMQSHHEAQRQAAQQAALDQAEKEIAAFAADEKAHPYFHEVSEKMMQILQANPKYSLQESYEEAVMAHSVTRAKEVARIQTETEAKLKENARLEALPKKKAIQANVKSRDTQRTPTEPVGTLEDALKTNLAALRARTS